MLAHRFILTVFLAISTSTSIANDKLTLSTGADYSSGKYGSNASTDTFAIPFAAKYETGLWTFKALIPWLRVTGPGNVVGADRILIGGAPAGRRTDSGFGDLVTAVTYAASYDQASGVGFDLTGKVKWGTADDSKSLGTGKNDYAVQVDAFKSLGATTLFGSLGYKVYGDPAGIDLQDVAYTSLGVSNKFSGTTSAGLSWDYRPRISQNGSSINEMTGFLTQTLSKQTRLQAYILRGFSNGSPDWGGGLNLSFLY